MKLKRPLIFIPVVVLGLLLGLVTKAFPYAWWETLGTPWHWNGGATTMYLHPVSFVSGSSWTSNMVAAMQDWTNVIGSPFTYYWITQAKDINDHGDGYNAVAFVSDHCDDWAGITYWRTYFLSAHLKDTDIWFDVDCNFVPNSPNNEISVFAEYNSFRHVATHELGHALGLDHDFSIVARMNYGYLFERLQGDDKNGVRFLYGGGGADIDVSVTNAVDTPDVFDLQGRRISPGYMRYVNPPSLSTVKPGDTIQVEYTVENMGNLALNNVSVGFYLGSYFLGRSYFNFPVRSIGTFTRTLTIPPSIPSGIYSLYVFIDDTNQFAENDETNNRFPNPWGPITVYHPPTTPGKPIASSVYSEYGPFSLSWTSSNSMRPIHYLLYHRYTLTIAGMFTKTYLLTYEAPGPFFNFAHLPVTTHTFWVKAVDDLGNESEPSPSTNVVVTQVNLAPVLTPIGNKFVYAGDALTFPISAKDPESDSLSYSSNNLPPGAFLFFKPIIGLKGNWYFTWTPSPSQIGAYNVTFTASDNFIIPKSTSETIQITVVNRGGLPKLPE